MRYEVTRFPPDQDADDPVITDAAGVPELVREAAQSGRRVHIRPIAKRRPDLQRLDGVDAQP